MNVVLFCHSLRSDWNHGNAHFLRGVVTELMARGFRVRVFEPAAGWSAQNLIFDAGADALTAYRAVYPDLEVETYELESLDVDAALDGATLVLVHEWNPPDLVARIGAHRRAHGGYRLLFHDTHHRMLTAPEEMGSFDLSGYDGVLAFGEVLRERYAALGWGRRAYTWHEAADARVFYPRPRPKRDGSLVWIGNFGDEERRRELSEFLIEPVRALKLGTRVYGVRYPSEVICQLTSAGIEWRGWLPNFAVPEVFAEFDVTLHVPRRPYAEVLHGIPTIRPFEALACGIPLVCAPWTDSEGLFREGRDYLSVSSGSQMRTTLAALLAEPARRAELAASGLERVRARHTCGHRVDELLAIARGLGSCALERNHRAPLAITPATPQGLS